MDYKSEYCFNYGKEFCWNCRVCDRRGSVAFINECRGNIKLKEEEKNNNVEQRI